MRRSRAAARVVVWSAVLLVAGGCGGWALRTVLAPPRATVDEDVPALVEVVDGEVEQSLTLNTVASWDLVPTGVGSAAGVVTSVDVAAGTEVGQGTVLFAVDERPVVAVAGAVPAFRDLAPGTTGADVTQVQQMLHDLGYLAGAASGTVDRATTSAVRAWQDASGVPADGTVRQGDLVVLPTLPTRVVLDPEVVRLGERLVGGERVASALSTAPTFSVPVTSAQAAMMPAGTLVRITDEELTWTGVAGTQTPDADTGTIDVALTPPEGQGSICGDDCARLPAGSPSLLTSQVVVVPATRGTVVPSAALTTDTTGTPVLVDEAGDAHPVTVVATAQGMTVVEGVRAGLRVRLPGAPGGTADGSP